MPAVMVIVLMVVFMLDVFETVISFGDIMACDKISMNIPTSST